MSNLSRIDVRYEQVVADANARGFNVLIVDEPWVVAPYESACRSAMALFYAESARRYPGPATDDSVGAVRRNCLSVRASATTTAEDYRAVVSQVEQAQQVEVVRLEGYSFASVRAAYLGPIRPNLVVAVGSPFPVGADAADFYTAVGTGVHQDQGMPRSGDLVADSALAYYASTGTSPATVDPTTAARALWQVDNAGDLSLSRAGYYSEICTALINWSAFVSRPHRGGTAVSAFASVHAPCAVADQPGTLRLPPKTCFNVLAGDRNSPWVPSRLTRDAHIRTVSTGEHGKVTIPACQ